MYYDQILLSSKQKLFFIICIAGAGMSIGILFYDSFLIGIAVSLILSVTLPAYKRKLKAKQKDVLLIQFRDMLYSISSSISSGRNMSQALSEAEEFCGSTYEKEDYIMMELRNMVLSIRNGNQKDSTVLMDFATRSGLEDIQDFVRVYENCKSTGGDMVKAINRATTIIGDKIELENDLKTLIAQKSFEGRIVGIAPFVIVLAVRLSSPAYLAPMTETSQGRFVTTIALALMGISIWLSERIIKIEI